MKIKKKPSQIHKKSRRGQVQPEKVISESQGDPIELSNLIFSFQNALATSNRGEAREILAKVTDAIEKQFEFEKKYLYPRLRRLVFGIIKRLNSEQHAINGFIIESKHLSHQHKVGKNQLFTLSKVIPILTSHLRDCNDLIILGTKFGEDKSAA